MWEHYRKTFTSVQLLIALVTVAIFVWCRAVTVTAVFFLMMQLGSVAGALWATRLKNKFRAAGWLPPRPL